MIAGKVVVAGVYRFWGDAASYEHAQTTNESLINNQCLRNYLFCLLVRLLSH